MPRLAVSTLRLATVLLAMLPAVAWSQTRQITGRVTVAGSGTPLAGANVSLENGPLVATSDAEGRFRLTAPDGPVTIIARYIGYKRGRAMLPAGQNTADFALERDVLQLESVVVTGQATTVERRSATTSPASGDPASR